MCSQPYHRCAFVDTSMQYYNYRIDRKYIGAICSRTLALLLWEKRVVNLQILDPGSPRRLGLQIPRTVVAPK
jgi:hypothetical protein